MARKANPALIGAFVVGAIILTVTAVAVLGGGKLFRRSQGVVAYFEGSLKGMAVGAPVTFNGVKVGAVTDIRVVVDDPRGTIRTPVFFEIDANRLVDASGNPIRFRTDAAAGLSRLTERGLRAQLELQSLVTGQLQIALNFHPGTPVTLTHLSPGYPEMPTIPSRMDRLSQTIESLPLAELVEDARRTLASVDALVTAPEILAAVRGVTHTLASTDRLVQRVAGEVAPIMANVETIARSADNTLAEVRQVIARLGPALETAVAEYQKVAASVDAQVVPLGTALVKVATTTDQTLAQAQQTLAQAHQTLAQAHVTVKTLDAAIDTDSPLRYDVARALHEVQLAARSLRGLTDYLEQHPEAVVSGKRANGVR